MLNITKSIAGRLALATGVAGATIATVGLVAAPAATAGPAAAGHPASKTEVVVKERSRPHFGRILVTKTGHALYYMPRGSCTGLCLSIWPRLVMPAGKTEPRGARCLGTKAFGKNHRLQVTYRGHRLYTFADDMGISVTGNGEGGFKVAKVVTGRCK